MAVQKLRIPGLVHENESLVEHTLAALDGVLFASASHVGECVEVEFDDDVVTTETMRQALQEIGLAARLGG